MSLTREEARKIVSASASGGGNIIRDGKYVFDVIRCLTKRAFRGGTVFIAELDVVDAEPTTPGVEPNRPGTTASWVLNLDNNPSAPGNVKGFLLALLGVDEARVSQDELESTTVDVVSDAQPARGMRIADETFRKVIRGGPNAGKDFVAHRWQNVQQTPQEVAARRAALDQARK